MSLVPLSRLLPLGRPGRTVIAERDGAPLTLSDLAADVSATVTRLSLARPRRALLVAEDCYLFIVGLLALLQLEAEIVMPPNAQPGTLFSLREAVDLLLADAPHPGLDADVIGSARGDARSELRPLDPRSCRFSFFTSGSTGERKRIGKTLAQLETEVATLDRLWGDRRGAGRALGMVTHQHIFGLTFHLLWPLMTGRPFATWLHLAWESLIGALQGGETLVVSPAHLARVGGLAPLSPERRPRAIFTAGAPLSREAALESAAIFGSLPIEIFGSTETGAIAWRSQSEAGQPWQPLPGMIIECGVEDTLVLRSPFLAPGEVYHSADRIALGPGGFQFCGRADRVAKIEGKRVGLAEVERDLALLGWVREAAVAVIGGERAALAAVVVLTADGRTELARHGKFRFERLLRRALSQTQDWAALPRRWRFVDALPLDAMGKRQRAAIEALFTDAVASS